MARAQQASGKESRSKLTEPSILTALILGFCMHDCDLLGRDSVMAQSRESQSEFSGSDATSTLTVEERDEQLIERLADQMLR